jgi:hypothetical protein
MHTELIISNINLEKKKEERLLDIFRNIFLKVIIFPAVVEPCHKGKVMASERGASGSIPETFM